RVTSGEESPSSMRIVCCSYSSIVSVAAALLSFGYPYGESGVTGFQLDELSRSVNVRYTGPWLADSALARYCRGVWVPLLRPTHPPRRSVLTLRSRELSRT